MSFRLFIESSFQQLYNSAVQAFPHTTRRQHSTDTIVINELRWIPYLGVRTLYLRGTADNTGDNGGIYRPIIMFKDVEYHDTLLPGLVEIVVDGHHYYLFPLSRNENDILCRCDCADFKWRFNFYDHLDYSLYSRVRAPYVRKTDWAPPANEFALPGLCKHLMKMFYSLQDAGIVI